MKYILFLFICMPLFGAPKASLIPFWNQSQESNGQSVSHEDFSLFLKRNTGTKNGITFVKYASVSVADKTLLARYIQKLSSTPIRSYAKKEQLPFWINLYNAQTLALILESYPINSIKEIPNRFIQSGPWNQKNIRIEGQNISLNDIEHGILRPIWKDFRIHFLVNCASIGCPNLHSEALRADNYEKIAELAAKNYIQHTRGLRIEGKILVLSSLFNWYGDDFGVNFDNMLQTLSSYTDSETAGFLKQAKKDAIRYEYDWKLNEEKNIK